MKHMKPRRQTPMLQRFTSAALAGAICVGSVVGVSVRAQSGATATPKRASTNSYPALARYATNLTKLARQGRLIAADEAASGLRRLEDALTNDNRRSPVLVSPLDEGRGAQVAERLALKIAAGDVPASLQGREVFRLNPDALAADVQDAGEVQARLRSVLVEAASAGGRIILFVDDLQRIAEPLAAAQVAATLSDASTRYGVRLIGATTPDVYAARIAAEPKLSELFRPVRLEDESAADKTADAEADAFVGDKISTDLRELMQGAKSPNARVPVILQADDTKNGALRTLLSRNGVLLGDRAAQLDTMRVDVPVKALEELANSNLVNHLSPDRQLDSFGHVTATTGVDQVRTQQSGSLLGLLPTYSARSTVQASASPCSTPASTRSTDQLMGT